MTSSYFSYYYFRILEFPIPAPENGKYHDFDEENVNHYYIAASQFYKMLHKQHSFPGARSITNQSDAIESIQYCVNTNSQKAFNRQRQLFKDQGKVKDGGKVKELLLFHGTDCSNIDSIFNTNFNIDIAPFPYKNKAMVYGRGVYMSEHPAISLCYGNKLLLCRVS